ncbi:MAG TPA: hypothetical protein VK192_06010 [Sphingomicrobium sp.]|nr:hypothetical protein [Sphingomicrobium sp.]
MSSSALAKAVNALKQKNESIKRFREKNKEGEKLVVGAVSQIGGAGVAGFVDARYGENGHPHKLFDTVPTVGVAGLVIGGIGLALSKKMPTVAVASVGAGLSMASCSLYAYLRENVEPAK